MKLETLKLIISKKKNKTEFAIVTNLSTGASEIFENFSFTQESALTSMVTTNNSVLDKAYEEKAIEKVGALEETQEP